MVPSTKYVYIFYKYNIECECECECKFKCRINITRSIQAAVRVYISNGASKLKNLFINKPGNPFYWKTTHFIVAHFVFSISLVVCSLRSLSLFAFEFYILNDIFSRLSLSLYSVMQKWLPSGSFERRRETKAKAKRKIHQNHSKPDEQ